MIPALNEDPPEVMVTVSAFAGAAISADAAIATAARMPAVLRIDFSLLEPKLKVLSKFLVRKLTASVRASVQKVNWQLTFPFEALFASFSRSDRLRSHLYVHRSAG
jgi:hypothetical protein